MQNGGRIAPAAGPFSAGGRGYLIIASTGIGSEMENSST